MTKPQNKCEICGIKTCESETGYCHYCTAIKKDLGDPSLDRIKAMSLSQRYGMRGNNQMATRWNIRLLKTYIAELSEETKERANTTIENLRNRYAGTRKRNKSSPATADG